MVEHLRRTRDADGAVYVAGNGAARHESGHSVVCDGLTTFLMKVLDVPSELRVRPHRAPTRSMSVGSVVAAVAMGPTQGFTPTLADAV